ncbi:MAG TPA: PHP domain-containing protein, partial [Microbacterium sp.]|nr:PHP domain-containing protein [Microbacterium sp.]
MSDVPGVDDALPELRGDHHVHSTFSDDAVSSLEENVAAAHAAGLTELRLVDHVRASTSWVPDFVAAVAALEVPDGLTVHTGVEAKILDASGSLDLPAGLRGLDRILMAD